MKEKDVENALVTKLKASDETPDILQRIRIARSTSDAVTLYDLICERKFEIYKDTSDWNPVPRFMTEIIGNMIPDIVVRSVSSGENRIYIEIKLFQALNYGVPDSQMVRYFLHLLAVSQSRVGNDIRRAVLLAAPATWFETSRNHEAWAHFVGKFTDLATSFHVTIGALYVDEIVGAGG